MPVHEKSALLHGVAVFLLSLLTAWGCGGSHGGPSLTGAKSTFAQIQENIFTVSCTSSSCHSSAGRAGNLVLEEAEAYGSLVWVKPDNPAARKAGKYRVTPADPDSSFLLHKLTATLVPEEGDPMPRNSTSLSEEKIALIRRWIAAGAPQEGQVAGVSGDFGEDVPAKIPPLPPPRPDEGFQVTLDPFPLAPGEEREVCQFMELPNETEIEIQRFEVAMHPGSHHFVLWVYNGTAAGQFPRALVDSPGCVGVGPADFYNRMDAAFAQETYNVVSFPPEVALRLKPHHPVLLNSHYINTSNVPFSGEAWVNLYLAKPGTVQHLAESLIVGNLNINVPPGQTWTTGATWTAPFDIHLFHLTSHTHKRGRLFTIATVGEEAQQEIYRSAEWDDPEILNFDPPLLIRQGQGLHFTCTYHNETPHPVTFGVTTEDEMCFIVGYYYRDDSTRTLPQLPGCYPQEQGLLCLIG